jgi:hypothetical protein
MSQQMYELVRENYKRCVEGSAPKPTALAKLIAEQVGLVDKQGRYLRREDGMPRLAADRKRTVDDFPLDVVTEAIFGRQWKDIIKGGMGRLLSEEAAAPIGPSYFAAMNAWNAATGGLVTAAILEGYATPDFTELAGLFPTKPIRFWNGGERLAVKIGPSEPSPKVGPGESHPDANLNAMWVEPGPMAKYGHKLTIARETAEVDIANGTTIEAARALGQGLQFREQELTIDVIVGTTNNFKLGLLADSSATGYNTYGATVPTGLGTTGTLGNDLINPYSEPFTTMQASEDALVGYKHPVTGITMPVAARLNTVLLPTTLSAFAGFLNGTGQLTIGAATGTGSPVANLGANYPTVQMTNNNPYANRFQVRVSQWLWERHTRSTTPPTANFSPGLGLSAANARRWYRLDPKSFAARRVGWEPNAVDIPTSSFVMADQGLVWGQVVDMAIQIQVLNPWMIQRNKAS